MKCTVTFSVRGIEGVDGIGVGVGVDPGGEAEQALLAYPRLFGHVVN